MPASLAMVTFVVRDQDEALRFFTGALRFDVIEDRVRDDGKRWLVVAPPGGRGATLLLARAANDAQAAAIGAQAGGRVAFFLETDDFARDHAHLQAHGVVFAEEPRREPYGTVAVFLDPCGNRWDLIERRASDGAPARTTREVVERFWATANERRWDEFAALLCPDMSYHVPQTRERAEGREGFVDVFRTWPGDWVVHVETQVADENGAFTAIRFVAGESEERGISHFEFRDGRISRVTDWWPASYDPPPRQSAWLKRHDATS